MAATGIAQTQPYARYIAPTEALSPDEQLRQFQVPPGFSVELVAAEPEIRKPVNLAFDAAGRLWVTQSVEYPFPAGQGSAPRDAIKILDDLNGDGRYDRARTFADGLNIPVGIVPVPGGAIAYDISTIRFLADDDGDRRADRRLELYGGFAYDDTHGLPNSFTRWLDGWIYACHGEGNVSTVSGRARESLQLEGGSTFRLRRDGSRIERISRGQANPFGLCFDPRGDLFTADSHSKPATLILRGAWYPGIDRRHDGLGLGPPLMNHFHDSTGIGGIACYADNVFPAEYQDNLFIGNPVTGRINRDRLAANGATYEAVAEPDLVSCSDPWFRPVHLQVGPDGALYIADFYNRIIGHSNVPLRHGERDRERGRIWRVAYTGHGENRSSRLPPPDLAVANAEQLIDSLQHPSLLLRTLATHELVDRIGAPAVDLLRPQLAPTSHPWLAAHGIWVLVRLDALDVTTAQRLAQHTASIVRTHLMRAIGEGFDCEPGDEWHRVLLAGLRDTDAFTRRAAVDALGRHPHVANAGPLLELWEATPTADAFLVHTLRMAVRDSLSGANDWAALAHDATVARRQCLADVGLGLPTPTAARWLLEYLRSPAAAAAPDRQPEFLQHAARYLDDALLPELYAHAASFENQDAFQQRAVLQALRDAAVARRAPQPAALQAWAVRTTRRLLDAADEFDVTLGIEMAGELQLRELADRLHPLAAPSSRFPSLRSLAMEALAAAAPDTCEPLLGTALADLGESPDLRDKAADLLGRLNTASARQALVDHLPQVSARIATTIARRLSATKPGAEALLLAVEQGQASGQLLADATVDQLLRGWRDEEIESRLLRLIVALPDAELELARALERLRNEFAAATPDPRHGAAVFAKHCAACHAWRERGARIGPALDGIASRGADRLLEDIVWPHRNVDVRYRSTALELQDGRVLVGLVIADDATGVTWADQQGKQDRLPAAAIVRRRSLSVSPMPANYREVLSETELFDLLAALLGR